MSWTNMQSDSSGDGIGRRRYLSAIGVGVGSVLAGCASGSGGGGTTSPTESSDGGMDTATQTATATGTPSSSDGGLTFGFALNTTGGTWKRIFQRTGELYAEEALGVDLITTGAEFDASKQIDQVRSMLNQGIDALLLNPASSDAVVGVTEQVAGEGIPVYTADVSTPTSSVNLFTGFGSVRGGRRAGEQLIEAMEETGGSNIYAIMGDPAVETIALRKRGLDQAVAEADGVQVVGSGPGEFSRDETVTSLDAFMRQEQVDAVFSTWGGGALAAVTVLERNDMLAPKGEDGHVPIVPIDGFPDVLENIREGFVDAALQQPMPAYAPLSFELMVQHLDAGGYQGPSAGGEVTADGLTLQDVEVDGVRPWAEQFWAPASVTSWESDGESFHPWMKPRATMITEDNVDASFLWGNYADTIM
jgi:ribose transport system substrate-binding protein